MKQSSQKLRVLHVLPSLGIGGAEIMAGHLMAGMAETHEVAAVALYPRRNSSVEWKLERAKVALYHLGKRPGVDLRMLPALRRVIREFQPAVVHSHLSVLRYLYPALLLEKVPLALHTLHNAAQKEADTFGKFVQRLAFRKAVVPIAISKDGASTYASVYGRECPAVVPNCVPIEEYQASANEGQLWRASNKVPADAVVFTCVGRLDEQKNPLGLLAAFSSVKSERARLVLLGGGTLRDQVENAVRAMALRGRVFVLGERDEVKECLAGSDVFVLGSRWEGSPLAVMEAMAAGLPVISTAVGGVPELVEDGKEGLLVPLGQPGALGRAMQTLADDGDRRKAMGAAARRRAEAEFGVGAMTQKYASLYQWLLSRPQGRPVGTWNPERAYAASSVDREAR